MKNLIKSVCAAIILLCIMLVSCTKEYSPVPDPSSAPTPKTGAVFTVAPSGNYDDDSYNIQSALDDAVTAGPGSTVQLTAGTFYLKERIEIDGFDGYFTGAGMNTTIITTHEPLINDITNGDQFALLKFRHGNLRMSDLTFNITLAEPVNSTAEFGNALPALIMVTGNSLDDPPTTDQEASASFDNIKFLGGPGYFIDSYNIAYFLWLGGEWNYIVPYEITESEFAVTDCYFEHGAICITNSGENNCTWQVGGNGATGNTMVDMFQGVLLGESSNCSYEISYNSISGVIWGGLVLSQGWILDPTTLSLSDFYIHHNDIQMVDFGDGILLIDDGFYTGSDKLLNAVVSNNQIELVDGMGGIYAEGLQDAIITNNKVFGAGWIGIYFPTWYPESGEISTNCFLKANNVQDLSVSTGVHILLGWYTSEFTVIGGSNKTNVRNRGTNNYLTGVNIVEDMNLGQDVEAAMKQKHEMMKEFMDKGN